MPWTFSKLGTTSSSHTSHLGKELIWVEENGCKDHLRRQKD